MPKGWWALAGAASETLSSKGAATRPALRTAVPGVEKVKVDPRREMAWRAF